ncbi:MAG: acylneuraminate cytidylyltransferase family protein [Pseudomonadota bacterium]
MIDNHKILCLICARGGSKGIPRKNIRLLGDKPLIAWSIEAALNCDFIDRIVVSTDDIAIADISRQHRAETPFIRPPELAQDDSPEWLVWQHAIKELETTEGFRSEYLVSLPPTSPFRSKEDIAKGIQAIHQVNADIIISVKEAGRNPYFNMVEIDDTGLARLCKTADKKVTRRQSAPKVYDMTTVAYATRTDFVLKAGGIFEGKVGVIIIPEVRALDIDTELDWKFAEFLLSEGYI